MVTRFVVNYYILLIDANASARQNVVITTFCNVTTFWVATMLIVFSSILINTSIPFISIIPNMLAVVTMS